MSDHQILGTYDLEKKVEDTVILLDAKRGFVGDVNRMSQLIRGIMELCAAKQALDSSDRFALVTFGETQQVNLRFEDYSLETIINALEEVSPLGSSTYLGEGMAAALQVLIEELRKLSTGKIMRMIIISDGEFKQHEQDWNGLADEYKGIGIFIDGLQVIDYDKPSDIMKRCARITGGDFIMCELSDMAANAASMAVKKGRSSISQTTEDKNLPAALIDKIAAPLLPLGDKIKTPQDLIDIVTNESKETMCAICHSDSCMMCHGPKYACGCFCPQCGRFMHLHCASAWAESQKDMPSNVLKCPVCFFLLKVPQSVYRIKVLKGRLKDFYDPKSLKFDARMTSIDQLGTAGLSAKCAICNNVFDAGEEFYQCGNPECGAFYHKDCYSEFSPKSGDRCRVCDGQMRLKLGAHPGIQRIV
ncbi:MAG TPA: VWA domain-containing protein [Candidatus Lokiarchaeia archaeon]|nr:VWA domain-containing protein [Candidatus Lokiarchaeia archaeon]